MTATPATIGVDVGATVIAVGLVGADGKVTSRLQASTPTSAGSIAMVDTITQLVGTVKHAHGERSGHVTVGVAVTGIVDPTRGIITGSASDLRGWMTTPLAKRLSLSTGHAVAVVNDVTAYLLAERTYGAARQLTQVLGVTVGAKVAGALIIDGRLVHGHRYSAEGLGHVAALSALGRGCPCGVDGHVEAISSEPAMTAEYAHRSRGPDVDVATILQRERAGDTLARDVLTEGGAALGTTLGGLVNTIAPEVVIMGGTVVSESAVYMLAVRQAMRRVLHPALAGTQAIQGQLGQEATLVGAGLAGRVMALAVLA